MNHVVVPHVKMSRKLLDSQLMYMSIFVFTIFNILHTHYLQLQVTAPAPSRIHTHMVRDKSATADATQLEPNRPFGTNSALTSAQSEFKHHLPA